MLSFESSEISLCGCFPGSCLFGLLDCLSRQKFLFFLLCFQLLSCFFCLQSLQLFVSLLCQNFLFLPLFLSLSDLFFQIQVLLQLSLSLFLFRFQLLQQLLLLLLLFRFQLLQSLLSKWVYKLVGVHRRCGNLTSSKGESLLMSFFSRFFQSFFHRLKFLQLVRRALSVGRDRKVDWVRNLSHDFGLVWRPIVNRLLLDSH